MIHRNAAARIAAMACLLSSCLVHSAAARDGYWHGLRDDVWNHGSDGEISNWYSLPPPQGAPVDDPNKTAGFADGALRQNLRVTRNVQIGRINFDAGAPQYTFRVARDRVFLVNGRGIVNNSASTPKFTILARAVLIFINQAAISKGGGLDAAFIETFDEGSLVFNTEAKGGNARVVNKAGGRTSFRENASAESMTITNSKFSRTHFEDRATGANAHVINEEGGRLSLQYGSGPSGNHEIPFRRIDNDGAVNAGVNNVLIGSTFVQGANAALVLRLRGQFQGRLSVTGKARLDGHLQVECIDAVAGQYTIVNAVGGRSGRFASLECRELNPALKARLAYSSLEVKLIIEPK